MNINEYTPLLIKTVDTIERWWKYPTFSGGVYSVEAA